MKVLIVGSGAREHALAWRLLQSLRLSGLWVANGNAATASLGTNLDVKPEDVGGVVGAAASLGVDLVVVGPEAPLSLGLVNQLTAKGIPAFGPTKEAAQIETSKSFALEVMQEAGVPCPEFRVFRQESEALAYLIEHPEPLVVKANGLAAGKGVFLCDNAEESAAAVRACMSGRVFGGAGETVVIEEMLSGPEVSVFAFCDGERLSSLVAACDYKRLKDGDHGPNTGGMGSFSPPGFWNESLAGEVERSIMQPVLDAMARRGAPYRGVLYAGLMLTEAGPKVLEFNCRLGDPETQVILPLLATDPLDVMQACVEGSLDRCLVEWKRQCYVGVVMASGGYPDSFGTGFAISGLDDFDGSDGTNFDADTLVFQGATRRESESPEPHSDTPSLVTNGGRVLTVVGRGASLAEARTKAYDGVRRIHFHGAHYRTDIAAAENRIAAWSRSPAPSTG